MSVLTKNPAPDTATGGAKRRSGAAAPVAASPRADLLPAEIGLAHKHKAARRGMRVVVVVAIVLALVGSGVAWQFSVAAGNNLADAQKETQDLAVQKGQHAKIASTISGIAEGKAALAVGGSTDIDWADYLAKLQATLPSGVTLKSVDLKSADATSTFVQSTIPLEGTRIATITFTADSATVPSIPQWVNGLSTLPGFADASPDSVTQSDSGGYEAQVTMHVNAEAYSHRFDKKEGSK